MTYLPVNNFTVNVMEHYERIRPGSKIAWPKCDCKPELKIGWRNNIIIKRCCRLRRRSTTECARHLPGFAISSLQSNPGVNFYNSRLIHSALQYRMPDQVYFKTCNRQTMAYSKPRGFTPIF